METINSVIYKLKQNGNPTLLNKTNLGTPNSGVEAEEYGDAFNHTTILTINKTSALTFADNAALADGYLLYTLPAGAVIVNNAYMNVLVSGGVTANTVAGEIGLGTVIGSGAVAALNGTATFENVLTGQAFTKGTATVGMDICNSTGGIGGLLIPAANAHTIHLNAAATWDDLTGTVTGATLNADITGTVIINWTFLI